MDKIFENENDVLAHIAKMSETRFQARQNREPEPEFSPVKVTPELLQSLKAAPEYTHHFGTFSPEDGVVHITFFGFIIKVSE